MWTIEFFRDEDGSCPVLEFCGKGKRSKTKQVKRVPKDTFDRLLAIIKVHLKEKGTQARGDVFKKFDDNFYQLRFADCYRVLCYIPKPKTIVLLHAFQKTTNDTPENKTIDKALTNMKKDIAIREKKRQDSDASTKGGNKQS